MSRLKNLLRCFVFVGVTFLITGCFSGRIFSDSLLVKQNEITPIDRLGFKFYALTPKGVDPNDKYGGMYGISSDLKEAGFFSGRWGSSFEMGMADTFSKNGLQAFSLPLPILVGNVDSNSVPAIDIKEAGNFSHFLEVAPTSFSASSNLASGMRAEMRLYDLKQKMIVWKAEFDVYFHRPVSADGGRQQGIMEAEFALIYLDEKGLITLSEENRAQLFEKKKMYFEHVKDKTYLEYVDRKRRAQ